MEVLSSQSDRPDADISQLAKGEEMIDPYWHALEFDYARCFQPPISN